MDLDEDPFEEAYDDDYEEALPSWMSSRDSRRRPFYANRPPPYYRPGQTHQGTMTAPGSPPVPVRFGQNFVRADQMDAALKKVQNDVLELASAIKSLKLAQGGGSNALLPLMLLGGGLGQSAPQIEKVTFSNNNNAPFDSAGDVNVSNTTYKPQKSNLPLILALTMMGDSKDSSSNNMLLLALALGGI